MTDQTRSTHAAPQEVVNLVARFTDQRDIYRSGKYNETQLRNDFLDPLFEALGWDINNRKNYSEKYREVVKEVSVGVDGASKAADYAFQSGGHIHFLVEAKKPAVNIKTNPDSAFQIRRYGWSAKEVNISVLSNFEQLAIYDCRQKPVHGDPVSRGLANLYSFTEYLDKWDEIAGLLSYGAVHRGSLEKFTDSLKGKRGTADVDDDFLATMEHWREELARVIALRNTKLTQREINTAVQLIIDRIIFLRICEDRGIEPENGLRDATDGIDVYGDLMQLFTKADKKYNSGLFHFSTEKGQSSYPDTLTPTLKIDDKVLKDILVHLYPPVSPYAFKYFSAEILGQVYERFLGKVIRLTAGGHAKVEEKPEVRKAGGVYYTPTYVVDYIVKNTVGELLKDKTPADLEANPIRIVDPACGSGSFLLGAYQFLLDWSLNWYMANDPAKWSRGKNPPIFEADQGWQLTMETKKALLTRHIFGVDIDAQAVEVTKLSLLLKVVENPGQLTLLGERILPDLGENIKCGNSLIGPDYYDNQQLTMFDSEEQYRVNAFDWHKAFPKAFAKGGFDAVVGNPPYGAYLYDEDKKYLLKNYVCQSYQLDTYLLFLEKSNKQLLRFNGFFGMIIPNPWLTNILQTNTRKFVVDNTRVIKIIHFKFPVFKNVTVDTEVLILQKANVINWKPEVNIVNSLLAWAETGKDIKNIDIIFHNQDKWRLKDGGVINIFLSETETLLSEKIFTSGVRLGNSFFINVGIKPYQVGKGKPPQTRETVDKRPFDSTTQIDATYRTCLRGSDIQKYIISPLVPRFLKYGDWLAEPRPAANFDAPVKIFVRQTGDSLVAVIDTEKHLCMNNMHVLVPKSDSISCHFILGLVNSRLLNWYYHSLNPEIGEALAEVKKTNVEILPMRTINFSDPAEVAQHDRMVALVETMLSLHKQSAAARLPDEKERLARQIESTDRQINKLVYALYGLSAEEIKIVEGG